MFKYHRVGKFSNNIDLRKLDFNLLNILMILKQVLFDDFHYVTNQSLIFNLKYNLLTNLVTFLLIQMPSEYGLRLLRAPELDSNPGSQNFATQALITLLYCFVGILSYICSNKKTFMAVQKGSTENFAQFFVTHSIQTHETRTMGGLVVSIGLFCLYFVLFSYNGGVSVGSFLIARLIIITSAHSF